MIRNIVIMYSGSDWNKKTPFSEGGSATKKSFEDWYVRAKKYDIKFYRASIDWFDMTKGAFLKSWTFENGEWIKVNEQIRPVVIYDKTAGKYDNETFEEKMGIFKKIPIVNHPLFRTITNNKLSQYMLFGKYMPTTCFANNKNELRDALKKIKGSQIVVKPLHGCGGFGIFIGSKDASLNEKLPYPVIVQEFITSTKGIPNFSQQDEVSDLRLIYTDHNLVYALSRIAQKGSLFTNFHQGATVALVPNDKIPESVSIISQSIVKRLSLFPHANYSLDFIFDDNGKPIFVEMNTTPGFDLLHIVGTEQIKKRNIELFINTVNTITQ